MPSLDTETLCCLPLLEHIFLDLWRNHDGGILRQAFPNLLNDNKGFGPMPLLADMAQLRGPGCNNAAYVFLVEVFGAAVYGETIFKDVIDYNLLDTAPEIKKKERWQEAMTRFTINDEALILTILKDCWDVWVKKARKEFKRKLWESSRGNWYDEHDTDTQIDTTFVAQHVYSGGLNSSRGMSEEGLDYFENVEEKIRKVDRAGDRSDKFMEFLCRDLIVQG